MANTAEAVTADTSSDSGQSTGEIPAINEQEAALKTVGKPFIEKPKMSMRDVNVFYADKQAIFNVNLDIGKNEVISMIGPSGCGKSTFLRCLNRMNDTIELCKVGGSLELEGQDIYDPKLDVVPLIICDKSNVTCPTVKPKH